MITRVNPNKCTVKAKTQTLTRSVQKRKRCLIADGLFTQSLGSELCRSQRMPEPPASKMAKRKSSCLYQMGAYFYSDPRVTSLNYSNHWAKSKTISPHAFFNRYLYVRKKHHCNGAEMA